MVQRDELSAIARRYDTAMSRAMLRAVGLPAPRVSRRGVPFVRDEVDPEVRWCFENHGSPMDLLR